MKSFFSRLFKPASSITSLGMAVDTPIVGRRVLIFTEHFNATYYISFDIPLRALHERGEASFRAYDQQAVADGGEGCWRQWLDSFRPDVVFFTRYGRADGANIMHDCSIRGIPVIYHIDDNLLDLPTSLGSEIVARQGAATEARGSMLEQCDLIYASTAVLSEVLGKKFVGKPIYYGIYATLIDVDVQPVATSESLTIGYMGSKGHKEDLALVVPALMRLMEERPNLRFETFGTIEMPRELRVFEERVKHHTVKKKYQEFLQTLAKLNWLIGLAPLVNEPFNQCKAPTKYLEYTSCKIPAVASNVIVYNNVIKDGAGLLVDEDWYEAISKLLDNENLRKSVIEEANKDCNKNFDSGRLQAQILKCIDLAFDSKSKLINH